MKTFCLVVALGVGLGGSAAAPGWSGSWTSPYLNLAVYGDSYADPGNFFEYGVDVPLPPPLPPLTLLPSGLFPPAPYFEGQFSNGNVFSTQLQADFAAAGKATANYAVGAAQAAPDGDQIPDLAIQVAASRNPALIPVPYPFPVPPLPPGAGTLALIHAGGNDLLGVLNDSDLTEQKITDTAMAAVDAIIEQMLILKGDGVGDFMILNLGDFSKLPRVINSDAYTDNPDLIESASGIFNMLLADALNDFDGMPGTTVFQPDLFGLFDEIAADPLAFGIGTAALPALPLGDSCGEPAAPLNIGGFDIPRYDFGDCQTVVPGDLATARHLFFDDVHPVVQVHSAFADLARAQVLAAQVPLPLAVLALGSGLAMLGGLGAARRVRR